MRRAALAPGRGEAQLRSPRIQVVTDSSRRASRSTTTARGLTRIEIDGYLSTIGRSGTDELRQRIREGDRSRVGFPVLHRCEADLEGAS
jgi:molecular chaperone HtpG